MDNLELKGRNGVVVLEKNVVVIKREGVMGFLSSGTLSNGEKRIPIKSIISVELGKEPSFLGWISYIRFATAGDTEKRTPFNPNMPFTNRAAQVFNDPNTVQISNAEQYEVAIKIRNYIENYQEGSGSQVQTTSGADEIQKYKKLLDDGIITQEEFDAKKKQLLGI